MTVMIAIVVHTHYMTIHTFRKNAKKKDVKPAAPVTYYKTTVPAVLLSTDIQPQMKSAYALFRRTSNKPLPPPPKKVCIAMCL